MRKILILFILLATETVLASQNVQDSINRGIYDKALESVCGKENEDTGDLVADLAAFFCGTPYVASTLEGSGEELRIFLDKTDCILFVESCVCLALTAKGLRMTQGSTPLPEKPSFELYCDNVRNMRYRGGMVNGYASRLHYTSEWILQASENGILKEYTQAIGTAAKQRFSFMSTHADLYPALKESSENVNLIREAEKRLEASGPFSIVSKETLDSIEVSAALRRGDIVAFVSETEGLDITHVAIACPSEDGKMHIIHASSKAGKVVFEQKTLSEYTHTGIRLARLTF